MFCLVAKYTTCHTDLSYNHSTAYLSANRCPPQCTSPPRPQCGTTATPPCSVAPQLQAKHLRNLHSIDTWLIHMLAVEHKIDCWLLLSNQSFYRQIAGYGMGVGDHRVSE